MKKAEREPPRPLQLQRILRHAFVLSWVHRKEVIHRCGMPLLVIIGITLVWNSVSPELLANQLFVWTGWGIYAAANCWLALAVHRMVLLDEPGTALRLDSPSLQRFANYLVAAVFVWVVYQVAFFTGAGLVSVGLNRPYVPGSEGGSGVSQAIGAAASLVGFVILGRVSLVLPMVAVDRPFDMLEAWLKSEGNAWRMAVLVGVLPWLLLTFTEMLHRDGFSRLEQALIVTVSALTVVVEVVALSFAYRELTTPPTEPAPPPTDPPA